MAVGSYGVLDTTSPEWVGLPMLLLGVLLGALGLASGSGAVTRTTYRPSPWPSPETVTAVCGVFAAAAAFASAHWEPSARTMPLTPLGPPPLPWPLTLGLLVATLPALLTPAPPVTRERDRVRRPTATTEGSHP